MVIAVYDAWPFRFTSMLAFRKSPPAPGHPRIVPCCVTNMKNAGFPGLVLTPEPPLKVVPVGCTGVETPGADGKLTTSPAGTPSPLISDDVAVPLFAVH